MFPKMSELFIFSISFSTSGNKRLLPFLVLFSGEIKHLSQFYFLEGIFALQFTRTFAITFSFNPT
jgi:hypothetical protein